jgi:hypothetical protein
VTTLHRVKAPRKLLGSARLLLPEDGMSGQLIVAGADDDIRPTADVCVAVFPSGAKSSRRRLVHDFVTAHPDYKLVATHELSDGGTVIELHRSDHVRRIIDVVFDEAAGGSDLRFSSSGDLVATYGDGHLLRVSLEESPNTWAMRTLHDRPRTPRLIAWGREAGAYWAIESKLGGAHPHRIGRNLARDLVAYSATLPRQQIPPIAPSEDLEEMRTLLPEREFAWTKAEEILDSGVVEWSVARHGDLRTGNILSSRGRLVGVVGWDHWHAFAVPGADLLNLFAPHAGSEIGNRFRTRPWLFPSFRKHTQVYWGSFRLEMTEPVLMAAAVAWWVGQLSVAARRDPGVTSDERWVIDNIDAVAAIL